MYPDIVNKKLRLPPKAFAFYDEPLAQRSLLPSLLVPEPLSPFLVFLVVLFSPASFDSLF